MRYPVVCGEFQDKAVSVRVDHPTGVFVLVQYSTVQYSIVQYSTILYSVCTLQSGTLE